MDHENDRLVKLLLERLHQYEFLGLAAVAAITGAVLIALQHRFIYPEITRDFGIALFAAGTVGFAVELHTRRTFRDLLKKDVRAAVDTSALAKTADSLVMAVRHTLQDVVAIGSLSGDLRELGVARIHRKREEVKFIELIDRAEPNTEVRFLGVCLSAFVDRNTQGIIERKLEQNCSMKFLILDPRSDAVDEHARLEGRTAESVRTDIEGDRTLHKISSVIAWRKTCARGSN